MEGSYAIPNRPIFNPPNDEQNRIKDHELLLCASIFLLGRTGRTTMERPDITSGSRAVGDAAAALAVLVVLVADGSVAAVHVGGVVAPRLLLQPVQLRRPALR